MMSTDNEIIGYIENNNYKEFYKNISIKLINESNAFEIALNRGKQGFLQYMLSKVIDTNIIKKAKWKCYRPHIREICTNRITLLDAKTKAGYNRLHIAVMDNEVELVDYLLTEHKDQYYNSSSNVLIGTPLHLAIMLCHFECVKKFIDHDVDVDITDRNGLTPLDLLIIHNIDKQCDELYNLSKNIDETGKTGLSILQMATLYNRVSAIDAILNAGANMTIPLEVVDATAMKDLVMRHCTKTECMPLTNKENCVTLYLKLFKTIPQCMLSRLDEQSMAMFDGAGNTLLHLAVCTYDHSLCNSLILKGVSIDALNNCGDNALHELFRVRGNQTKKPRQIGMLLVDNNIDVDMEGSDGRSVLSKVSQLHCEKFFIKVLKAGTILDLTVEEFELIAKKGWLKAVNEILSSLDKLTIQLYLTEEVIDSYFERGTDEDLLMVVKKYTPSFKHNILNKVINRAALRHRVDIFNECLEMYDEDPMLLENGESLLTSLILNYNWSFATLLLESEYGPYHANMKNKTGAYPLHLSTRLQHTCLCTLLISKGADVNAIDGDGNNPFVVMLNSITDFNASRKSIIDIGTMLIVNGADMNVNDSDGKTVLRRVLELNDELFFEKVIESMNVIDLTVEEFQEIVTKKWYGVVTSILSVEDPEIRRQYIVRYVVDGCHNHDSMAVLWEILDEGSLAVKGEVVNKFIDRSVHDNDLEMFKEYLKKYDSDRPLLSDGETLLTSLMISEHVSFVGVLLESTHGEEYINVRNKSDQYPLHVAMILKEKNLIDNMVVETIDVNGEDINGETCLALLFEHFQSEEDIPFVKRVAKIIISKGGDPNHKNNAGIMDIDRCKIAILKENIQEYISKHPVKVSLNRECTICLNEVIDCSLDCGHVYCTTCAEKVDVCPACRKPKTTIRKLYL